MKINDAGLDLIKSFEGLRLDAYKDSVGVWTIGYGTTAMAGVGIEPKAGMRITEAEAEWYLQKAVNKFGDQIEGSIFVPINENEWAAYLSLSYNIGPGAFKKSSTLRHFNDLNKAKAAQNILLWNKAGGEVLRGLVRRREAEKVLFETLVVDETPENVAKTPNIGIIAAIVAFIAFIFGVKK